MTKLRVHLLAALLLAACSAPPDTGTDDVDLAEVAPLGAAARAELERCLAHELEQKDLGAISIAIVDRDRVVWSAGFGELDAEGEGEAEDPRPATADTIYRVGSVTKLFTDIALMRAIERGRLSLDTPVRNVLSDFLPENPFGGRITLGQLAAHRSGLVREPPVGSYFDPDQPSLAATVASLNRTVLVAAPGTVTKYSNAGLAVIGRVLEVVYRRPFDQVIELQVLRNLGLPPSAEGGPGIERTGAMAPRLARGKMWTYDGRVFPAPTFELGMAPAGNLYASMLDLAALIPVVTGSADLEEPLLAPGTLARMLEPTLDEEGDPTRYGLGFALGDLDGRLRCGHGGAIYGHSTELAILPTERLGVAIACATDVSNAVTRRLADHALRVTIADRVGRGVPALELGEPVAESALERLPGHFQAEDGETIDLRRQEDRLVLEQGGMRRELRAHGKTLRVDDRHTFGPVVEPVTGVGLDLDGKRFFRRRAEQPAPCPDLWLERIGEYGWDHNVLLVRENEGELEALIEWFWFDRLTEVLPDVYALPEDRGLYPRESLHFERDETGKIVGASLGGVLFPRRAQPGDEAFRIEPVAPIGELRASAREAQAPSGLAPDVEPSDEPLVDLERVVPDLVLDVRYATDDNFLGAAVYESPRAFLRESAAAALARVQESLRPRGLALGVFDAYRPWSVTKLFWDATPAEMKHFVADPSAGSRHNRGCAVDLTLVDSLHGAAVRMPSGYDEFTHRASPSYPGGTSLERWHRDLLLEEMRAEGFEVYAWEWWHFDFEGWERHPIENVPFEALGK